MNHTLTPAELEAIGQERLFDQGEAATVLPQVEPTGRQFLLF